MRDWFKARDVTPDEERPTLIESYPELAVSGFAALFLLTLALSIFAFSDPTTLPGVALGAVEIFHLLRAALITAVLGLLAFFLVHGAAGRWPREIGGGPAKFGYGDRLAQQADQSLRDADAELQAQLDALVKETDEKISVLNSKQSELIELLVALSHELQQRQRPAPTTDANDGSE